MDGEGVLSPTDEDQEESDVSIPEALFTVGFPLVSMFNFLAAITSLFFFFTMLLNRTIRTNPYNFYIIWLIFPDAFNTICRGMKLAFVGANKGVLMPNGFYEIFIFAYFFYFAANFYLNTVVAYEINTLAMSSYQRKKVAPPTMTRVYKQVGAVYAFAIFSGLWTTLPVSWAILHMIDGTRGKIVTGSPPGGVFTEQDATIIIYVFLLVPTAYVLFVRVRIAIKKLLPKRGRTRVLSLFFMRILIVFFVFYFPTSFLTRTFIASSNYGSTSYYWVELIVGCLASGQAGVTLYMISLKDDIRKVIHEALPSFLQRYFCRPIANGAGRGRTSVTGIAKNRWNASDEYSSRIRASLSRIRSSGSGLSSRDSAKRGNVVDNKQPSELTSGNNLSSPSPISQETARSEWEEEDVYEADEEPKAEEEDTPAEGDVEDARAEESHNHIISRSSSHSSIDMA